MDDSSRRLLLANIGNRTRVIDGNEDIMTTDASSLSNFVPQSTRSIYFMCASSDSLSSHRYERNRSS